MDRKLDNIAENFRAAHDVKISANGGFPSWNSLWLIDGKPMRSAGVKRLLIPAVMEMVGPDPKMLKRVMWRIMATIK